MSAARYARSRPISLRCQVSLILDVQLVSSSLCLAFVWISNTADLCNVGSSTCFLFSVLLPISQPTRATWQFVLETFCVWELWFVLLYAPGKLKELFGFFQRIIVHCIKYHWFKNVVDAKGETESDLQTESRVEPIFSDLWQTNWTERICWQPRSQGSPLSVPAERDG